MEDIFERIKNAEYKDRTLCAICGMKLGNTIIDLPDLPLGEIYVDKVYNHRIGLFDQGLHLCTFCGHVQLSRLIDPEVLYGLNYFFKTSMSVASVSGNNYFFEFINKVVGRKNFENIIEIGCNDLFLLKKLSDKGTRLIGIDPVLKKLPECDHDVQIFADYFEDVDIKKIIDSKLSLVISSHNLEHIEEPREMIKRIFDSLDDNDICIFQFPGFETLLKELRFDQIFHHHLHYFSLQSIEYLINSLGGEIISYDVNKQHWGSLMVAFKKERSPIKKYEYEYSDIVYKENIVSRYLFFKRRMKILNDLLCEIENTGPLYVYGATLSLPILAYHIGYDFSKVKGIIDDDENKKYMFYLSLSSQIVGSLQNISDKENTTVLVSAIDNNRQIIPKLINKNFKKIITIFNEF